MGIIIFSISLVVVGIRCHNRCENALESVQCFTRVSLWMLIWLDIYYALERASFLTPSTNSNANPSWNILTDTPKNSFTSSLGVDLAQLTGEIHYHI